MNQHPRPAHGAPPEALPLTTAEVRSLWALTRTQQLAGRNGTAVRGRATVRDVAAAEGHHNAGNVAQRLAQLDGHGLVIRPTAAGAPYRSRLVVVSEARG